MMERIIVKSYKCTSKNQCYIFRSVSIGTDRKSRTGMQTGTRHPHVPPRPKFWGVSTVSACFGLFRPVCVIRPEYFLVISEKSSGSGGGARKEATPQSWRVRVLVISKRSVAIDLTVMMANRVGDGVDQLLV